MRMRLPQRLSSPLRFAAAIAFCGFVAAALAQAPAPQAPAPVAKPAAPPASQSMTRGARNSQPRPTLGPVWRELSPSQQKALTPLSAPWDTLSEAQKRKWIALSANYPKMSGEEQAKLHSRMTEWVSLSSQQRSAARLNYGETKEISPDDKKAKWEAYQALPPEEKKKLAAGAQKPPATGAAVKPVPQEKLASVPKPRASAAAHAGKTPRIAAGPNQVDHNTLLPQQSQPPGSAN